jgi:hypothetical protein
VYKGKCEKKRGSVAKLQRIQTNEEKARRDESVQKVKTNQK